MTETLSQSKKWNDEYQRFHAIPSSIRKDPAHVLKEFGKEFWQSGNRKKTLDLGCGNGRNSIYLESLGHDIKALDFSSGALDILSSRLNELSPKRIGLVQADVLAGIPFEEKTFDYILDSYFHCHFVHEREWQKILSEVDRALANHGKFISIQLSTDDAYYKSSKYIELSTGYISADKFNGFKKVHYDCGEYKKRLSRYFSNVEEKNISFKDVVDGKEYIRSVVCYIANK